jgi:hypothetical protein
VNLKPKEEEMKTNNMFKVVLTMALVLGMLFAVSAVAAEETFTGIIDENDEGVFILSSDDGEDYILNGSGLDSMVGKTVKVTGTLAEDADPKAISIMKIEALEEE